MFEEMNNPNNDLIAFKDISEIRIGIMLAAAFLDENNRAEYYYRAKVVAINGKDSILVEFIDFGNMDQRKLSELKSLRGVSNQFLLDPPHCFQCAPAFIQPSQMRAPDGIWPTGGKECFVAKTDGKEIKIKVRSWNIFFLSNHFHLHKVLCILIGIFGCSWSGTSTCIFR